VLENPENLKKTGKKKSSPARLKANKAKMTKL
jgi:hypothetical protein